MAQAKRKKRFFDIEMPIIKKTTQLMAFEPKELEGHFIKYDLTRILKGKSALLQLVVKLDGENLTSIPREIVLLPYFIKRMVRKGTNYVEDSFSAECKDATLRIKPFLITRRKVSREVRKKLRENAKADLIEFVKDKDSELIFDEILKNKLQKQLSMRLKKIYPLSLCELKIVKVEKFKE